MEEGAWIREEDPEVYEGSFVQPGFVKLFACHCWRIFRMDSYAEGGATLDGRQKKDA